MLALLGGHLFIGLNLLQHLRVTGFDLFQLSKDLIGLLNDLLVLGVLKGSWKLLLDWLLWKKRHGLSPFVVFLVPLHV